MSSPNFGLAFAYWLHMVATVLWLGSLAAVSLFVIPAARKTLPVSGYSKLMFVLQRRLQQVGWFSLAVLGFTGMFQMSAHPAYQGFLSITNAWSAAILAKHLVIGLMVGLSVYSTWILTPALQRLALRMERIGDFDSAELQSLQKRESLLIRINLAVSLVVLVLTAAARAS
jgi:uncharacterized membrane protein